MLHVHMHSTSKKFQTCSNYHGSDKVDLFSISYRFNKVNHNFVVSVCRLNITNMALRLSYIYGPYCKSFLLSC